MALNPYLQVGLASDASDEDKNAAASRVADLFKSFIDASKSTLDIAIYDFRLSGPAADTVLQALSAAGKRGVATRIAYFQQRQSRTRSDHFSAYGADPAPDVDHAFLGKLQGTSGVTLQSINEEALDAQEAAQAAAGSDEPISGAGHLMHSKYIVRDAASVWMGSANFTNDAWSVQDNNIVTVDSADLANYYLTDFNELWQNGTIRGTGKDDFGRVHIDADIVDVLFSPGEGPRIGEELASLIASAEKKISLASMVISSQPVLQALSNAIDKDIELSGVYDGPEMNNVIRDWEKNLANGRDKIDLWQKVSEKLVAKHSNPYSTGGVHNFMHNKLIVVDGSSMATGSFNFSLNAERNAENILFIQSEALSKQYKKFVDKLVSTYGKPTSK